MNGWPDPDDTCPYCGTCATPANCGAALDSPAEEETP